MCCSPLAVVAFMASIFMQLAASRHPSKCSTFFNVYFLLKNKQFYLCTCTLPTHIWFIFAHTCTQHCGEAHARQTNILWALGLVWVHSNIDEWVLDLYNSSKQEIKFLFMSESSQYTQEAAFLRAAHLSVFFDLSTNPVHPSPLTQTDQWKVISNGHSLRSPKNLSYK